MPKKNNWDEIRDRLLNYAEEADDSWEKISSAISSTHVRSSSAKYWVASALVGIISLLLPFTLMDYETGPSIKQEAIVTSTNIENAEVEKGPVIPAVETEHTRQNTIPSISTTVANGNRVPKTELADKNFAEPKSYHYNNPLLEQMVSPTELTEIMPTPNVQAILLTKTKSDSILLSPSNAKTTMDSTQKAPDTATVKKRGKLKLAHYATVTPLLNYYLITSKEALNGRVNGFDSKGIFSTERFGISAEVGIRLAIKRKLELFSGLAYYHQSQQLSYPFVHSDMLEVEKVEGSLTYTITPQQSSQTIRYQMNNIGVNLGLLYEINLRKGLNQQAGVSLLYQYGLSSNGSNYKNQSSSYWWYQLSYLITIDFGKNKFFVQPSLLNPILSKENLNEPISIKATRVGIGMGMIF